MFKLTIYVKTVQRVVIFALKTEHVKNAQLMNILFLMGQEDVNVINFSISTIILQLVKTV